MPIGEAKLDMATTIIVAAMLKYSMRKTRMRPKNRWRLFETETSRCLKFFALRFAA
jgi:hypothetical protein